MRTAEYLRPRWAAAPTAALSVFGLAATVVARTEMTRARNMGTVEDASGVVPLGVTSAVRTLQNSPGGS